MFYFNWIVFWSPVDEVVAVLWSVLSPALWGGGWRGPGGRAGAAAAGSGGTASGTQGEVGITSRTCHQQRHIDHRALIQHGVTQWSWPWSLCHTIQVLRGQQHAMRDAFSLIINLCITVIMSVLWQPRYQKNVADTDVLQLLHKRAFLIVSQ